MADLSNYELARQLLGNGLPEDKTAGIGYAILALVDELALTPGEQQVATTREQPRSWQS